MIYFIQCGGKKGPVKIGYTDNGLEKRMRELSVGNPYSLKLLGIMAGNQVYERRVHKQFRDHAIGGEWFKFTEFLKNFIIINCPNNIYKEIMPISSFEIKEDADFFTTGFKLGDKLKEYERLLIIMALERESWHQTKAAYLLGIGKSGLSQKIKEYGLKKQSVA